MRKATQSAKLPTTEVETPSTVDDEEYVPEAAGTGWMVEEKRKAELAVARVFSDVDLSEVDSWETAMSFVEGAFGEVVNAADALGSGFKMATDEDMARLEGVPLVLMQWMFYAGDYGKDFVAVNAIQRHDNGSITKWILTDGGTGMCVQLAEYTKRTGRTGGLGVPKGLRISKYYIDRETKTALSKAEVAEGLATGRKMDPAHTIYIDTSA